MTDLEKRLRRLSSTALGVDTIKRIAFAALWSMRAKPVKLPKSDMRDMSDMPAFNQPAEAQIVMLIEAVMLGYSLARKVGRGRE